jgi:hypothetical protein
MAIQHRSQIETSISRLDQTAYGTARAYSDDWRRIISDTQDVGELSTEFQDDAGYDQGTDLANDLWAVKNDSSIALTPDFCFQDAGFLLKDALGGYAVSQLETGPYLHTFTPQNVNTSRQLPSRTILKKYGSLGLYLFRDMVSEQFSLSGGKNGRLKMKGQYKGSGYYAIDPASYTSPAIVADREWGYAQQLASLRLNTGGTSQVETATPAGTANAPGNATLTLTSANLTGSPIAVVVALAGTENAAAQAGKFRAALRANRVINSRFRITGSSTVILTDRFKAANDGSLNLAIVGNATTGITDVASSANTTAGVAGTSQGYSCNLETWMLTLNNPKGDDGYRQCDSYLVDGDPLSGAIRSEHLLGVRDFSLEFTARLDSSDPLRGWMKAGTQFSLLIPIFGIDSNDHSLVISHDVCRVVDVQRDPGRGRVHRDHGHAAPDGSLRLDRL